MSREGVDELLGTGKIVQRDRFTSNTFKDRPTNRPTDTYFSSEPVIELSHFALGSQDLLRLKKAAVYGG